MAATHPAKQHRALIFDSGVGGLSIVDQVRQTLPNVAITYVADHAGFPYGTKSENWIIERVPPLLEVLAAAHLPDIITIACNSASTLVLPHLRARLAIPIVGTVPAIKPAAAISTSKTMGLLATPGTIARDYTDDLITDFAPDCTILRLGTHELVRLAERKLTGASVSIDEVAQAIAPLFDMDTKQKMDTVILACTHFPLLKHELRRASPRPVQWIDSGNAIARRMGEVLTETHTQTTKTPATDHAVITTTDRNAVIDWPLYERAGFEEIQPYLVSV